MWDHQYIVSCLLVTSSALHRVLQDMWNVEVEVRMMDWGGYKDKTPSYTPSKKIGMPLPGRSYFVRSLLVNCKTTYELETQTLILFTNPFYLFSTLRRTRVLSRVLTRHLQGYQEGY